MGSILRYFKSSPNKRYNRKARKLNEKRLKLKEKEIDAELKGIKEQEHYERKLTRQRRTRYVKTNVGHIVRGAQIYGSAISKKLARKPKLPFGGFESAKPQ